MALLQSHRGLHCDSPTRAVNSTQNVLPCLILLIPQGQLSWIIQVAALFSPQTAFSAKPFPNLSPIQRWKPILSPYKWAEAVYPAVKYATLRNQRHCDLLLYSGVYHFLKRRHPGMPLI